MQRVAFVGLGTMGEPMAANLIKQGFPVTVVGHRRPEPVERLRDLGASVAANAAEAASSCDIVLLMLPSSREVEAALEGEGGIAEALAAGSVVVDCSTSEPASTRRLAQDLAAHDIAFVDAPVTRGVQGAKQGKLAYFVGGSSQDFERVRPVLEAMGDTFFHMGEVGTGHATKVLSNGLSYATVALVNEMLMLGNQFGIDLGRLQEALMAGANSKALESFGPRIIAREYEPVRVSVHNVVAHLKIAQDMAAGGAPLALTTTARDVFDKASAAGHDASDMSSIAELWPSR